jgi:hypothetical protein
MRRRIKIAILSRPVGWLLHQVNARPPAMARTEFYRLKVRLCKEYGYWERAELQHVVKECWGCREDTYIKGCRHCLIEGVRPGVYREFWSRLERWNVGGFPFHEPTQRYERKPEWHGVEIEGLIEHEGKFVLSRECWLWLALLFDRAEFWRCFRGGSTVAGLMPLLFIQRTYRRIVHKWKWSPSPWLRPARFAGLVIQHYRNRVDFTSRFPVSEGLYPPHWETLRNLWANTAPDSYGPPF